MAAYNSAKAALASFTMSMQLELEGENIRVVDLQPADISTNFNEAVSKSDASDPRLAKAWQTVDQNMKAAPKPELVASAVLEINRPKKSAATRHGRRHISIAFRAVNI